MKRVQLKNGEELTVREALPADAKGVLNHMRKVGDESDTLTFSSKEIIREVEEQAKIIQENLDTENKVFILALLGDELVGVMNVTASNRARLKHVGEFGISVRKVHWQKGIATFMLNYMMEWAEANSILRKINLRVLAHNTGAIGLYEKLGFEREGILRSDFYLDDKYHDCVLMGKYVD